MFSFFSLNKSILNSGLLEDMTDIHSHVLPGVDDGMCSMEESYHACEYLAKIGVKRMFLTPHIMADLPDNYPNTLQKHFKAFIQDNLSGIEFCLAGEYMLDSGFSRQMEAGILTIGDKFVLVETSYMAAPPEMRGMLYELSISGYCPLIAHPERYLYMTLRELTGLKRQKCKFQLNLMSLVGIYGKEVQKRALFMLKNGLYDFIGSDIHDLRIYQQALSKIYLSKSEQERIRILMNNNQQLG